MLAESNVTAMVAVSDSKIAKDFYATKLGLHVVDENFGGTAFRCGNGTLFVYNSPTAGHNQSTCVTWEVTNIGAVVADLKEKGITFEHYDMPGSEWDGDVAIMGTSKAAWFKDPDGNILGLSQM